MALRFNEAAGQALNHQWKEQRRVQRCIKEMREWVLFVETMQFAGRQLPVSFSRESAEQIELLLMGELDRLSRQSD